MHGRTVYASCLVFSSEYRWHDGCFHMNRTTYLLHNTQEEHAMPRVCGQNNGISPFRACRFPANDPLMSWVWTSKTCLFVFTFLGKDLVHLFFPWGKDLVHVICPGLPVTEPVQHKSSMCSIFSIKHNKEFTCKENVTKSYLNKTNNATI